MKLNTDILLVRTRKSNSNNLIHTTEYQPKMVTFLNDDTYF